MKKILFISIIILINSFYTKTFDFNCWVNFNNYGAPSFGVGTGSPYYNYPPYYYSPNNFTVAPYYSYEIYDPYEYDYYDYDIY
jgi:hypothetical protein